MSFWLNLFVVWAANAPEWVEAVGAMFAGFSAALALPLSLHVYRIRRIRNRLQSGEPPSPIPVLRAAASIIEQMLAQGSVDLATLKKFDREARDARLLFGAETARYLDELRDKTLEAQRMRAIIITPGPGVFRPQAKQRWSELMEWFARQPAFIEAKLRLPSKAGESRRIGRPE